MPRGYSYSMVIFGVVLVVMSIVEARQSANANAEPQSITCAKLADQGYGDNAHVKLTGFYLCTSAYVYEEKIEWTAAWVPAIPSNSPTALKLKRAEDAPDRQPDVQIRGEEIKLIVQLREARNHDDVIRLSKGQSLQGLLIHPNDFFSREQRKLMEESYPGLDFNNCLILNVGREPASMGKTVGIISAGAVLALLGTFFIVRDVRKSKPESDDDEGWVDVKQS